MQNISSLEIAITVFRRLPKAALGAAAAQGSLYAQLPLARNAARVIDRVFLVTTATMVATHPPGF